jgi:hypothetical protein
MRAGSGAVLLVGFALVVMLLSVIGAINQPSIIMKQDPSQDFVDIAGSVSELLSLCKNLASNNPEKAKEYMGKALDTLRINLENKGLELESPIVSADGSYCEVMYYLYSKDGSSFFEFYKKSSTAGGGGAGGGGGGGGGEENNINNNLPIVVCNKASGGGRSTCFIRNPCSNTVTIKLVAPNGERIHVIFPGQGQGAINSRGTAEFYLDPMQTSVCQGVSLGKRVLAIATIYTDEGYLTLTVENGCCTGQCSFQIPLSCGNDVTCSLNYGQFLQTLKGISECKP